MTKVRISTPQCPLQPFASPRNSVERYRLTYAMLEEFTGTLNGFDDYVNMVLEDVTEL